MPNDAKLGLVVGMVLVLVIAAVFFRKEAAAADTDEPALSAPAYNAPRTRTKRPEIPASPTDALPPPAID